jgi:hypothetical protein
MRELRSEEIGDRRVALVEIGEERYSVTIAVRGPTGTWEDICIVSHPHHLLRYRHRALACPGGVKRFASYNGSGSWCGTR